MKNYQRCGVLCAVAAVLLTPPGRSTAQPIGVSYFENPSDVEFSAGTQSLDSSISAVPELSLSFFAFGQQFDIELQSNRRIMRRASRALLQPGRRLGIYRGKLRNLPDSWVRITMYRDVIYGAIWDGYELYAIEPGVIGSGNGFAKSLSQHVIYRHSDMRGQFRDLIVYPEESVDAVAADAAGAETIPQILAAAVDPAQALSIGIVGDSAFLEMFTGDPEPWVIGVINIVDGIFLWQVGLQIAIGELQLFDEADDPFTDSTPTGLLDELSSLRTASTELLAHGLTHLLTGRDLEGETIGIANVGVLCSVRNAVGLTQTGRGQLNDALTVAHEIAHNLGAPHDAEADSACFDAPPMLMAPRLNGSQELSQCSIDQMMPEISAATCLTDIPQNDVSLSLVGAPLSIEAAEGFTIDLDIETSGPNPAVALEVLLGRGSLELTGRPSLPWVCTEQADDISCRLNNLPANSVSRLSVEMFQPERADFSVPIEVTSVNDPVTDNNSLIVDIDTRVPVELQVSHDQDELVIRHREQSEIRVSVANEGFASADRIEFVVSRPDGLEIVAIDPSSGECDAPTEAGFEFRCELGELQPGNAHEIGIVIQAGQPADFEPDQDVWMREFLFTDALAFNDGEPEDREGGSTTVIVSERLVDLSYAVAVPQNGNADQTVVVTGTLTNAGPDTATRARLHIAFDERLIEISEVQADDAECRFDNLFKDVECIIDELGPGEDLVVAVSGSYAEATTDTARLFVSSREWNLSQEIRPGSTPHAFAIGPVLIGFGDNSSQPPAASGGGGGGAVNPITLLVLWVFTPLFRRRRAYYRYVSGD